MAAVPEVDIRATLLTVIAELAPQGKSDGGLQSGHVLRETSQRLRLGHDNEQGQALLTLLHDMFRTGYLAWGFNLSNPNPPFFHLTARGRGLLSRLSRDPGNPAGYLAHLRVTAELTDVAHSYLHEAVECYVAGLFKASAVMIGAAAETLTLELRDALLRRFANGGGKAPKDLDDWRVKRVLDALQTFFSIRKNELPPDLRDEVEAYWPAFTQQIRAVRNEAGHPTNVDPVTAESVHASLLIFPELAGLQNRMARWVGEFTPV